MVENSYLSQSDEVRSSIIVFLHLQINQKVICFWFFQVVKLMERVETAFIKHFANANRRHGMSDLRPRARREMHRVTFFVGKL